MRQNLPRGAAGCSILTGGAKGLWDTHTPTPQPGISRASHPSYFPPGAGEGAWSWRRLGRSSSVSFCPGRGRRCRRVNQVTEEKQVQVRWGGSDASEANGF